MCTIYICTALVWEPIIFNECPVGIIAQFSEQQYMVDESDGYALLKVTVSGYRTFAISVDAKIFLSSRFQPKAGSYISIRISYVHSRIYSHIALVHVKLKL